MSDIEVRRAFQNQAVWCDRLGSPFTAALMRAAEATLDRSTATGRRILDWTGPPDAVGDAVPLRLAGGLHALVRAGRLPELAPLYPPMPIPEEARLAAALAETLARHDAEILPWLDSPPQTNEVGRSSLLYPGLMALAAATGLPLELMEIGSSAGLNLRLDRFAYALGGRALGDPASPVRLFPRWTGPAPEGPDPVIASRAGCDLNPIDPTDPAGAARLVGYVWPDQMERLARVQAALTVAAGTTATIDRAEAADWVEARLSAPQKEGVARVLMHSITFQYLPEASQQRIHAAMTRAGAAATATRPLAWLAFEQAPEGGPALDLTLWPGGGTRRLATADAHGWAVAWRPQAP